MMRDYSKISPQFWLSEMGRKLRNIGPEAQLIALYLLSSPHSTMFGIYYLPYLLIAHETGLSESQVREVMQQLIQLGFCSYDEQFEYVWVHEMARGQMAVQLKSNDNRVKAMNKYLAQLPPLCFMEAIYEAYGEDFHLAPFSKTNTHPSKKLPKAYPLVQNEIFNEAAKIEITSHSKSSTDFKSSDILDVLAKMHQDAADEPLQEISHSTIDENNLFYERKTPPDDLHSIKHTPLPASIHASSLIAVQCVFDKWKKLSGQLNLELPLDLREAINQALISGYTPEELYRVCEVCVQRYPHSTPHDLLTLLRSRTSINEALGLKTQMHQPPHLKGMVNHSASFLQGAIHGN